MKQLEQTITTIAEIVTIAAVMALVLIGSTYVIKASKDVKKGITELTRS